MSQAQTQLAVALLARVAAQGGRGVQAAAAGESEPSDKDEEAGTCALHLVWANRYEVEVRRLRAEIKRQRSFLRLMSVEKSSASPSSFVSLVEYEQRMQEGCAYDSPFDADGVRSSEASVGRDEPTRSRASSGSGAEELHGSFPSMDSGVFLPFDAGEEQREASTSSLLDQLEDLMSHPQEELTESVEDDLLQECLYSSSESLVDSGKTASTCHSVRSSDDCEVTVSCSELCDCLPTCRKGSSLESLHKEEIQCRCGESESQSTSVEENCSITSLLEENSLMKSLLEENCSVKSLLEEIRLSDTGEHENLDKKFPCVNRLEESDRAKSSDATSAKSHVIESEFGWSLVEDDHPEGPCSEESGGNSPAELQRSYSEEDHLETSNEEENECDSSFADSISLEENQSAEPTCEENQSAEPTCEENQSAEPTCEENQSAEPTCEENPVAVPNTDDSQEREKKRKAESSAAETLCASQHREPSAEANQHDGEGEEEPAEKAGKLAYPDGKISRLERRAQDVRNGMTGITRLSVESKVDFVSLDNQVSSLLRSVRDTLRQSKIVVALESLCNILEQRLEEEWWAAYDLHLAPAERNYIV